MHGTFFGMSMPEIMHFYISRLCSLHTLGYFVTQISKEKAAGFAGAKCIESMLGFRWR